MRGCSSSGISGESRRDCNSAFLASNDNSSSLIDNAETPSLMAWMNLPISRDCRELLATMRQAGAVLHAQPAHFARELLAELLEKVLTQELLL